MLYIYQYKVMYKNILIPKNEKKNDLVDRQEDDREKSCFHGAHD